MADPITAHGWTATTDDGGAVLQHWGGNVTGLGHAARADLARCIEDASTLAKVRQLAQLADDLTDACPAHPEDPALLVDTCPYCRLLVHLLGGPDA